jgi:hypothetical protein
MKKMFYLAFIAAICFVGSGCQRASPPAPPAVGRFQLRVEDRIVIFDTATGSMYILNTNGTFMVRNPVLETTPANQSK